ncbi:aldo/keto reductase [Escherichia coli]|nr:amidohydrolase family protein [Escherichia coli]
MKTLPPVALGTWSWGTGFAGGDTVFGNHLSDTQMAEVFTAAMSKGLNLWDTAAVYGMGSSETALGALVRQFPRENIILSTKFTPQIADKQSAQPVSDMLEASLGRLGVDAIDIYWIHNPLDVEKWTPGLIPLLQSGKVKRVGVSNHNLAQIRRANEILNASGYSLSAVQNHYSLLYRASEEAGILDYCRQNNITFFAYMVLEQGALSGRYDSNHPMPAGSGRAESYNAVLPQIERLTAAMKKILDDSLPLAATGLSRTLTRTFQQHVYVTPSGMLTLPHFQFIYELMGAERILFSVDYPYQTLDGVKTFIDSLPVNKAEKEAIAFRNAERLLCITA